MFLNGRNKLCGVNGYFKCLFEKKNVCLSVCLTFFESADARDLGLMTLFLFEFVFRCDKAPLQLAVSAGRLDGQLVGRSVTHSFDVIGLLGSLSLSLSCSCSRSRSRSCTCSCSRSCSSARSLFGAVLCRLVRNRNKMLTFYRYSACSSLFRYCDLIAYSTYGRG